MYIRLGRACVFARVGSFVLHRLILFMLYSPASCSHECVSVLPPRDAILSHAVASLAILLLV